MVVIVLDMSHPPEERVVDEFLTAANNMVRIVHLRHSLPPLLVHPNCRGIHQVLLGSVNPNRHRHHYQSQHHCNRRIVPLDIRTAKRENDSISFI